MRERDDRRDQGHRVRIAVHGYDERAVDLERLHRKLRQITQRGITRPEVIDGNVDPEFANGFQFADIALNILHDQAFGDFEVDAYRRHALENRLLDDSDEIALP